MRSTLLRSARRDSIVARTAGSKSPEALRPNTITKGPSGWTATCDARLFRCGSALVVSRNGLPGSVRQSVAAIASIDTSTPGRGIAVSTNVTAGLVSPRKRCWSSRSICGVTDVSAT